MDKFYVQLDSFSRQLVHDYEGVMTKVAKLGYNGIEIFYGLHGGYSPEGLKKFLNSINMEVISSHVETEDTEENLKYLPGTGCKYMINPGLAITSVQEAHEAAEFLNEMGRKAKSVGMKYGYHNHSNDFLKLGDKMICDILIENTDPELVDLQLDTFWAARGGVDPAEMIRRYRDRLIMLHQKDFNKNAGEPINLFEERVDMSKEITRDTYLEARKETSFAEVGTGVLPIQKYIDAGNEAGIPYILLEQDFTFLNQMDSVRISMESFRKYSGIEWS